MTIEYSARGENVERIQHALNRAGFHQTVDGKFGDATYAAVRQFQEENDLEVDGKVDEETLAALGLDLDTLEELSPSSGDGSIVFTEEEAKLDVPPSVAEKIQQYVRLVEDQHQKLLNALDAALHNFETTMSFASAADAQPDIFGALVSTATVDQCPLH